MAEINQAHARRLYNRLVVSVDPKSVRFKPRQHKGDVLFCGYVDLQIGLTEGIDGVMETIPLLVLCGSTVKVIGGKVRFEPKKEKTSEKSTSEKPYHSVWYPSTPGARAVLDTKVSRLPVIRDMVEQAMRQVNMSPAAMAAKYSPL